MEAFAIYSIYVMLSALGLYFVWVLGHYVVVPAVDFIVESMMCDMVAKKYNMTRIYDVSKAMPNHSTVVLCGLHGHYLYQVPGSANGCATKAASELVAKGYPARGIN